MLTINTKAIVGRVGQVGQVGGMGRLRGLGMWRRVVSYPKNINFSQSTINKNFRYT